MATLHIPRTDDARSVEQWEDAWRKHWEKTGFAPYELHVPTQVRHRKE